MITNDKITSRKVKITVTDALQMIMTCDPNDYARALGSMCVTNPAAVVEALNYVASQR